MKIDFATDADYNYILEKDTHIESSLIKSKIKEKEIFIFRESEYEIGWMRHGYFWDNIPFMNMIWINEKFRSRGYGKKAMLYWEILMRQKGFKIVMTSTLSNEDSQHFYRKQGYHDAGSLLLDNEPLEIIMTKKL